MLVSKDHPYCRNFKAYCRPAHNNKWIVKWRLFTSEKFDEVFDTEESARAFHQELERKIHEEGLDLSDCWLTTPEIQRYLDFWLKV